MNSHPRLHHYTPKVGHKVETLLQMRRENIAEPAAHRVTTNVV